MNIIRQALPYIAAAAAWGVALMGGLNEWLSALAAVMVGVQWEIMRKPVAVIVRMDRAMQPIESQEIF